MQLIDSHCHLSFPELASDLEGVVARARNAGVVRMLTIGTTLREFPEVKKIAEKYDDVYCSVGVHPHHAAEEDVSAEVIVSLTTSPKVVGIGEAGLDFHYDHSPRDVQEKVFREHIRACVKTGLPLIVHSRMAEADTMQIVNEERVGQKLKAVLHCFSSKRELAEWGLDAGFYISASGILTFKKSQDVRDIIKDVPLDRLLIETDSPYLAPQSRRGKTCEPAYIAETAQMLADIKGVSLEEIAEHTTANFLRLFDKVIGP